MLIFLRRAITAILITAAAGTSWAGVDAKEEQLPFETDVSAQKSFFQSKDSGADLESIFPKGKRSGIRTSLSVETAYSDNVDKEVDEVEAFMADGRFGLEAFRFSPRFKGSADYAYHAPLYLSESVSGRDLSGHDTAASFNWRAAEHFNLYGSGYRLQKVSDGLLESLPGITSSYENRENQYNGKAGFSWVLSDKANASGQYEYSYRDYISRQAEGEDTRIHNAGVNFSYVSPKQSSLGLEYSFLQQDKIISHGENRRHVGTASWTRAFQNYPAIYRTSSFGADYRVEKGIPFSGSNYLDQSLSLSPTLGATVNTDVVFTGGYRLISRERKENIRTWSAGIGLNHRFSSTAQGNFGGSYEIMRDEEMDVEKKYWQGNAGWSKKFSEVTSAALSYRQTLEYLPESEEMRRADVLSSELNTAFSKYTSASLMLSQAWEDVPISSTSDATTSTLTKKASLKIKSRLSEKMNSSLGVEYVSGKPDDPSAMGEFWYGRANASIVHNVLEKLSLGADGSLNRRQTDNSDEDYLLQDYNVFAKHALSDLFSFRVEYSYENRTYDEGSRHFWYHEHFVGAKATLSW